MSEQNPSAPHESAGAAPGSTEPVGAAPAKKKNPLVRILVPLAVVAALIAGGWWFSRDNVENAKVGDCVTGAPKTETTSDADSAKVVKCDDAKAEDKVIGVVEGKTSADFSATPVEELCAQWPTTMSAIWFGKEGGKGQVLCMEPLQK